MANWYVSSVKYALVATWQASTAYTVGQIVRQATAPAVNGSRCFRCSTAGTTGATEPTWSISKNSTTTSGTAVFTECSGQAIYNGDGGGAAWAAPHQTLCGIFPISAWIANGDTVYVDKNDTGVAWSTGIWWNGTLVSPNKIISIDPTTIPPTSQSSGAIQLISGSTDIAGSTMGAAYVYGVNFTQTGTGVSSIMAMTSDSSEHSVTFDTCKFTNGSGANQVIRIGSGIFVANHLYNQKKTYKNCDFIFGATGQCLCVYSGEVIIEGGTIASTGSIPTTLFKQTSNEQQYPADFKITLKGVDLSNISGTLFAMSSGRGLGHFTLINCKINPSLTPYSGTPLLSNNVNIKFHNCDNGSSNYKFAIYNPMGSLTTETTTVRSGGASDGTTPFSWKLITKSDCNKSFPFELDESVIWNDTTGSSKTITMEFCGGANLTDSDIWMDVEYLGDTGSPKSTTASTRNSFYFGAGTNYSSSSETWAGSPATKQYMSLSVTPQQKGAIKVRVYMGKASTTVYIDPKITVT